MTEKISASEVFDSLTGFDEIAISRAFGKSITDLAQGDRTLFLRALLFVIERRGGAKDTEAYRSAMGMIFGDLRGRFEVETPSDDDEGKDD